MARKKNHDEGHEEFQLLTEDDSFKSDFDGCSPNQIAALTGFIQAIGNVAAACQIANISRQTWYQWKRNDQNFQRALESVDEFFADQLEAAAQQFAFKGDSVLLIFMLKGKRRAKYDDAYARQERAFEKGALPADMITPVRAILVRDEPPERVKQQEAGGAAPDPQH